jgi:hypothetical protein
MRNALLLAGTIVALSSMVAARPTRAADAGTKGAAMKGVAWVNAEGSFEVKIAPVADDTGTGMGRMSIQKTWHGDIEATSRGEMLTAMGAGKGSGAYVAVERVTGSVNRRKGSFSLVHRGVMERGTQELSITVVPDSGTEELRGLAGTVKIRIDPDGKHFYSFDGTLPGN